MIDVTCAIIRNEDDEILVVRRGENSDHPLKWEFPGGKIHKGESREDCIIREIMEELEMGIIIYKQLDPVEHDYGHKKIRLFPFICDTLDELPVLSEHVDFKWQAPQNLMAIDFSEADIYVAENYLAGLTIMPKVEKLVGEEAGESAVDDAELQEMINSNLGLKAVDWIATSAIENPVIFRKLLEYSYSDDRKLAFRASWTLTKVCDKFPELIYPHLSDLIESLPKFTNESVQRSFLRILSLSDLNKVNSRNHGILAEYCFSMLRSGFSAIAIKAYSMDILYSLSVIYPELANELATSVRILIEDASAGIKSKGRSILKKIS
jgi:8-oxo-dGTP diphosphatase